MAPADGPLLTPQLLRDWPLPEADDGSDKHARGTALVLGGAVSTPGAVLLAGLAALRVGAGRLQLATVPGTAVALGVAVPEAKAEGLEDLADVRLDDVSALLVGPGLLGTDATRSLLDRLLPRVDGLPLVLDAVALHGLEGGLPSPGVLTPNGGELRALAGDDGDNGELALRVAKERGAVVATQGWVVAPDGRSWRNEAGNVGLATSGSGDVLAGAVLGLLARGAEPEQAACWATYLHSAAGDRLAARLGRTGFLARELLDALPEEMQVLAQP